MTNRRGRPPRPTEGKTMSIHPAERARMTPAQRDLADKLVRKHWHFAMLYHRSMYFRPCPVIRRWDGMRVRVDVWNRPGLKVFPSGRIVRHG